jgi:hypothetical protein
MAVTAWIPITRSSDLRPSPVPFNRSNALIWLYAAAMASASIAPAQGEGVAVPAQWRLTLANYAKRPLTLSELSQVSLTRLVTEGRHAELAHVLASGRPLRPTLDANVIMPVRKAERVAEDEADPDLGQEPEPLSPALSNAAPELATGELSGPAVSLNVRRYPRAAPVAR